MNETTDRDSISRFTGGVFLDSLEGKVMEYMVYGGVCEWLKQTVLKTVRPEMVSEVRILPPPPSFTFSVNFERLNSYA